jgi:hypothetical protein
LRKEDVPMTAMRTADKPGPSNDGRVHLRSLAALFFLALLGLLLLAACAGGGDDETGTPGGTRAPAATGSPAAEETATTAPQASDGGLDPCALVTKADAEEVLGGSLNDPDRQTAGPFESCSYIGETMENYVQVQVSNDVYTADSFDDAMQFAAGQLDTELAPVSGVGDNAYWFADVLWVQKGSVTLDILVTTPKLTDLRLQEDTEGEKQESLRITTELAAKALDRLP